LACEYLDPHHVRVFAACELVQPSDIRVSQLDLPPRAQQHSTSSRCRVPPSHLRGRAVERGGRALIETAYGTAAGWMDAPDRRVVAAKRKYRFVRLSGSSYIERRVARGR